VEGYFVHQSSYVDEGAQVGDGTRIWHFCHVMGGTTIGENCTLGQNVFVGSDVVIGDHVKIQNNVSVYQGVVLEDYVFCGPSMVFTNVKMPRSAFPRDPERDYLPTRVKHGASIGANATVVCGVTIGRWAFIAAGAVVTADVPDYALMVGLPARQVGWVCECGLKLSFTGGEAACECGRHYTQVDDGTVLRIKP
jgi:UDP-2-acetamido-3-amino-2,3-dideoxy-glucuronate N-acetyltransferase